MKYLVTLLALIMLVGCGMNPPFQRTSPAVVEDVLDSHPILITKKQPPRITVTVQEVKIVKRKQIASVSTGHRPKTYARVKKKASPHVVRAVRRMADTYTAIDKIGVDELAYWTEYYAKRNNIPPRLLIAMMATESDFKTNTCSRKGACGILQIRGSVWNIPRKELRNYRKTLEHGSNILALYRDKCRPGPNQLKCAVQMYNVGETSYLKHGIRAPSYLTDVRSNLKLIGARI